MQNYYLFSYCGCICERLRIAFRYGVFVKIQIIGLNTGVKWVETKINILIIFVVLLVVFEEIIWNKTPAW